MENSFVIQLKKNDIFVKITFINVERNIACGEKIVLIVFLLNRIDIAIKTFVERLFEREITLK